MLFEEWEIRLWNDYLSRPLSLPNVAISTIDAAIKWREPLTIDRARALCDKRFGNHPNAEQGAKFVYVASEEQPLINADIPLEAKHRARFDIELNEAGAIASDPEKYKRLFDDTAETYQSWLEAQAQNK